MSINPCPATDKIPLSLSPADTDRCATSDAPGQTLNTMAGLGTGDGSDSAIGTLQLPGSAVLAKNADSLSLSSLKPGDRLDKYLILDLLGRGGMGVVFKARDTILERTVAIKVLGPMLADHASARKRFIREGQSAAAVRHENVVTVYGVEGHETSPYLVLEFVEGISLEEHLTRSSPLPVEEIITLGTQIARGLAAAHQKGLVHRDIKPANILIEKDTGRVALADFGLARAVDDASISRQGEVCGTPHYMAPEQVCGGNVDHRADLFSLGSVLYYMCTGELPFWALHSMAVLRRVCEDQPRPITQCNRVIPEWLVDLIDRLHEKAPERRPQNAAEIVTALTARGGNAPTTQVMRVPIERKEHEKPSASHPGYAILLGLVFLLSLPVFYFLMPREEEPERPSEESVVRKREPEPEEVKPKEASPPSKTEPVKKELPKQVPIVKEPRKEPKPSKETMWEVQGTVVVLVQDEAAKTLFVDEGLFAREQTTSKVVKLRSGRNDIPTGEYKLESIPSAIPVIPRRFTVTPELAVRIQVGQVETVKSPSQGVEPILPDMPPPDRPPPPRLGPPPPPPRGR